MTANEDFNKAISDLKEANGAVGDAFTSAGNSLRTADEFVNGSPTPTTLGYGTRQSKLPNNRQAFSTRQIIHWVVPEGPIIQMYINPQSIGYNYKKTISPSRTRGGYVAQYFGPELPTLNIRGTTGTSGIEGINVLYDLYRYEQLAFDPYALYLAAENQKKVQGDLSNFQESFNYYTNASSTINNVLPPSLADIAFRIEMFYSGEVYRGFFTEFSIDEQADNMGFFTYTMNFTVTQRRGFRQNFFAWHRSPNDGPSQSNPQTGVPYSYSSLLEYGR